MNAVRAIACLAALLLAGRMLGADLSGANVRIVVPYPAGGPTDIIARLCAQKLSEVLGLSVLCRERQRGQRRARRRDKLR